ncbi:hypothetical protein MKX01_016959, partial [Papaver californicum]
AVTFSQDRYFSCALTISVIPRIWLQLHMKLMQLTTTNNYFTTPQSRWIILVSVVLSLGKEIVYCLNTPPRQQ